MRFSRLSLLFIPFILGVSCERDVLTGDSASGQISDRLVLRATIPANTKTFLNDESFGDIFWKSGDAISLFSAGSPAGGCKLTCSSTGQSVDFTGVDQGELSSPYFGLYPYNSTATLSSTSIITDLPFVQTSPKGTYDPAAYISVGKSTVMEMGFYNVCGGIRFSIDNPSITKVTFSGNNDEVIAGRISITPNQNETSASVVSNSQKVITLNLAAGESNGQYYYISLLPQPFSKGFTMTFFDASGAQVSKSVCDSYVEVKRSNFSTIRSADDPEMVKKISGGLDLSLGLGTSNCYIVSTPGSYKFPAVLGNSDTSVGNIQEVKVLWETANTLATILEKSIISSVRTNGSYIYFTTPDNLKNGNALIAAYGPQGDILWSWHIWVCKDYDPVSNIQIYSGSGARMMDRNIGALSASADALSNGLYYQWGRKDPFPGSSDLQPRTGDNVAPYAYSTHPMDTVLATNFIGSLDYATKHPDTFILVPSGFSNSQDWIVLARNNNLWKSQKTIYDPCPAGWRVPDCASTGVWAKCNVTYASSGDYIALTDGTKAWYPCNGYISANDATIRMNGNLAYYWSNSAQSMFVTLLQLNSSSNPGFYPTQNGKIRSEGHSVRCQRDE